MVIGMKARDKLHDWYAVQKKKILGKKIKPITGKGEKTQVEKG